MKARARLKNLDELDDDLTRLLIKSVKLEESGVTVHLVQVRELIDKLKRGVRLAIKREG